MPTFARHALLLGAAAMLLAACSSTDSSRGGRGGRGGGGGGGGGSDTGVVTDTGGDTGNDSGGSTCGDGAAGDEELCDGADLRGQSCEALGFDSGVLACSATCGGFDTSGCVGECTPNCAGRSCGPDPVCGTDCGSCTEGETCTPLGQCQGSPPTPVCGNGTREGAEVCDGADLAGNSCASLGYDRGALACSADCTTLVTAGCVSDCTPSCAGRACGPDPVCGISCGVCAGTDTCDAAGQCGSGGGNGPRFITFNSNVTQITQGESVTFTVVVTDPDGIDDVIGGTLQDPSTGRSYGSFATAASEGAYGITLDWLSIHRVRAITFTGTTEVRAFEAEFFDVAGNSATRQISITLTCNGLGVCDASCTDITTTSNCGSCGNACAVGGTCSSGTCTCPAGFGDCEGFCTDLTAATDCGTCGNDCGFSGSCVDGSCACDEGYRTCGGTCASEFNIASCGSRCASCSSTQTCSATGCTAAVDGDVRIRGTANILEVFHNGSWRPICDDQFDALDAAVACRQLGGSPVGFTVSQDAGTADFWLDDLGCSGAEPEVSSCGAAWGSEDCSSTEGVGLLCRPGVDDVCPAYTGQIVSINEVYYDPPGADGTGGSEFVELDAAPNANLSPYRLVFYDGATGTEYLRWELGAGAVADASGFFVAGGASVTGVDSIQSGPMQNGPDSVRLEHCDGTTVVDAVAYGSFSGSQISLGEGTPASAPASGESLSRLFEGVDSDNNAGDFAAGRPTPGAPNVLSGGDTLLFPLLASGTLDASDPTFTRPEERCAAGTTSGMRYDTYSAFNTGSTTLQVTATASWTGFDGFLAAYIGSFSPASPTLACVTANDDNAGATTSSSLVVANWAPGTRLTLVMTTYATGTGGGWSLTVTNP